MEIVYAYMTIFLLFIIVIVLLEELYEKNKKK